MTTNPMSENDPQVGCIYKLRSAYHDPDATPGELIFVVAVEPFEDPHPIFNNMLPVWPKITILVGEKLATWCYVTAQNWHEAYKKVVHA